MEDIAYWAPSAPPQTEFSNIDYCMLTKERQVLPASMLLAPYSEVKRIVHDEISECLPAEFVHPVCKQAMKEIRRLRQLKRTQSSIRIKKEHTVLSFA